MFEKYQIVFVHPFPEEGNENMQSIVNAESSPQASSQVNPLQVICPYVPLTIHAFFTALCGASKVFILFSASLFVSCVVIGVGKRARCFLKSAKLIVSARNITSLGSVYFVKRQKNKVLCVICNDVLDVKKEYNITRLNILPILINLHLQHNM